MGRYGTCRQVCIVLEAEDLLEYSLPVSDNLSLHTEVIGLRGLDPYRTTGLALHTHRLDHVGEHPNLIKYLRQDVEHPLYPGLPR